MSDPIVATSAQQQGAALVDGMSPVHLTIGFLAGVFGVDPHVAAMAFVGVRLFETAVREGTGHALFGRESGQSLGNELTDVALEFAGAHAGHYLRAKAQENSVSGLGGCTGCTALEAAKVYDPRRLEALRREVLRRFAGRRWMRGAVITRMPDGTFAVELRVADRTLDLLHAITRETRDIAWKPYPISIREVR